MTVPFSEAFKVWARIGVISFGGPAGQIALMHREVVEERGWLTEQQFLNALSFCTLLPGPEAMQLATYAGWRLHGVKGGLAAGLMFVLPGAVVIFALAALYMLFGQVSWVEAAFLGIKAAVLIIVLDALRKIAGRALNKTYHYVLAGLAFVGIFFLTLPFPLIVGLAALVGLVMAHRAKEQEVHEADPLEAAAKPKTVSTVAVWLVIWLGPLAALWLTLGDQHVLTQLGLFFSKLAVVTFGGAYAVLAYMAQEVVDIYGWMTAAEMLDGLGLAETTPGPLILVTEFVGILAAARDGAEGAISWPMAVAGGVVTLWVTFAPCFLWIFAGAPYVSRLAEAPRLRGALQGVTAAVVGVILNLSLWFALHVLVPDLEERFAGPVRYYAIPETGLAWEVAALAVVAAVLLFAAKQGVLRVLAISAVLGLAIGGL
ncbi:MAG: chromate efflux transporter [Alphaproteobacteria bacterium]|nr:chromate efflux transporter [Alphaproteobacteria bacterium]